MQDVMCDGDTHFVDEETYGLLENKPGYKS